MKQHHDCVSLNGKDISCFLIIPPIHYILTQTLEGWVWWQLLLQLDTTSNTKSLSLEILLEVIGCIRGITKMTITISLSVLCALSGVFIMTLPIPGGFRFNDHRLSSDSKQHYFIYIWYLKPLCWLWSIPSLHFITIVRSVFILTNNNQHIHIILDTVPYWGGLNVDRSNAI